MTTVRKTINGTVYEGKVIAYYKTLEGVPQIVVQCSPHTTFITHPSLVQIVEKPKKEADGG